MRRRKAIHPGAQASGHAAVLHVVGDFEGHLVALAQQRQRQQVIGFRGAVGDFDVVRRGARVDARPAPRAAGWCRWTGCSPAACRGWPSRSSPISPSSRRVTGRTPLSLMSISTRFSHVDCIRSISNWFDLQSAPQVAVFGDIQVFHAEPGEIRDGDARGIEGDRRIAECADLHRAARLLRRVLQFTQLLTLAARIHQQQRGAAQDLRVEFLLAGRVRAHGGDVRAGLQIGGVQQRAGGMPSR